MSKAKPFKLTAPRPLEHQEQAALFQYAAVQELRDPRWAMLNASQNGMRASSIHQARQAKACGMKKGFPDISFPVPANGYHGMYIELKRQGGVPSDVSKEQRVWLALLDSQGYLAVVAYGWDDAVKQIEKYLDGAQSTTPA